MDKDGIPAELLKHKVVFRPARDSATLSIKIFIPVTEETEENFRFLCHLLLTSHYDWYFGSRHLDLLKDKEGKRYTIPDFPKRDGQKKTKNAVVKTESKSDLLIYTITLKFFPPVQ